MYEGEKCMKFSSNKERNAVIVGIGVVCAFLLFAAISQFSNSSTSLDNAYLNLVEKKKVLAQMRIHLLKSIEMEKNAVMALTDEDSEAFARQSRAASALVEEDLKAFDSLSTKQPLHDEKRLIAEFSQCWTEQSKLDQAILESAVQNTNLKAAHLAKESGAKKIRHFEQLLEDILQTHNNSADEGRITQVVYRAVTAGLKLYALHSPHIAEADDTTMDQIEIQMKKEEDTVTQALDELARIMGQDEQGAVAGVRSVFSDFLEITAKVLHLSRQNSNIKSLELSLGKKRTIAAQCDALLASLQEIAQNKTFKARK